MDEREIKLAVKNLKIGFKTDGGKVQAVRDISFDLYKGETLAIVGESGSGKSVTNRAIMGILAGNAIKDGGEIIYDGQDLMKIPEEQFHKLRGDKISMIFQDSGAMTNQTRTIGKQFVEYICTHEDISKKDAWEKGIQMLARMRLPSGDNIMKSYPFQLSGGMRQRVGIAMAMTFQPKLLLADEPTSALDVTTQAQIVRQMMELRDEYKTSIIIVTHNLGVAAYMADQIVVMKDGEVVDAGDREQILHHSESTYTKGLLEAVPSLGGVRYV